MIPKNVIGMIAFSGTVRSGSLLGVLFRIREATSSILVLRYEVRELVGEGSINGTFWTVVATVALFKAG